MFVLALTMMRYDLAVIGGGPVGARAAIRAAELGKSVVVFDGAPSEMQFGGPTGLFSKALRDTAKRVKVEAYRSLGLDDESIWTQIKNECGRLAATNALTMRAELASAGCDVVRGVAKFRRGNGVTISADGATYQADYGLIATGSSSFRPDNIPFGPRVFDADSINSLQFLPKSVAISGSGIVAVEFAKIFISLGSEVTLVLRSKSPKKALEKIGLDKDLAAALVSDLSRSGVNFAKGTTCDDFEIPKNPRLPLKIHLSDGKVLKVDAYMAALGRRPNVNGLDLGNVGVKTDEYDNIVVDSSLKAAPSVFAAGDVVGRPFLASTGVAQGIQAVEAMFGQVKESTSVFGANYDPQSLLNDPLAFPVGIWSTPEVAWYGYTVQQAKDRGISPIEGMALYKECLRGVVFSPDGLLKIVVDEATRAIIGVHVVGTDACEIIHYGMELVRSGRTLDDLLGATYSAVTFHELYGVAARAASDPAAARMRRRAAGAAWANIERARSSLDSSSSGRIEKTTPTTPIPTPKPWYAR